MVPLVIKLPSESLVGFTKFLFSSKRSPLVARSIYFSADGISLVFIREIPNTGIIRNCYFDLEFQEIRLICNRNLSSYSYDLFNDSVIFFLDEFCSVKTKTYSYDNL